MESNHIPPGSVILLPEDAHALFAVINRTSGTINWSAVASDIGTTVEVARERYMRVLGANSVVGFARPGGASATSGSTTTAISSTQQPPTANILPAAQITASSSTSTTPAAASTTASTTSIPPSAQSTASTPTSTAPEAASTTVSTATVVASSTPYTTKIGDLRPRVLPRPTGQHRSCCFSGYRWCCYAENCVVHTQCGHDLRVHFKKAHGGQVASFDFARLVHRTEQEAMAWAQGEDMDEDEN